MKILSSESDNSGSTRHMKLSPSAWLSSASPGVYVAFCYTKNCFRTCGIVITHSKLTGMKTYLNHIYLIRTPHWEYLSTVVNSTEICVGNIYTYDRMAIWLSDK